MIDRLCENPNDAIVHFRTKCHIILANTILYRTDLAMCDALIISVQQDLLANQPTHQPTIALINTKFHWQ